MGRFVQDKRGIYCRNSKKYECKTKSGCELLEIQQKYHIFDGVSRAVDLCAAPGYWSRVLAKQLYSDAEMIDLFAEMQVAGTSGESSTNGDAEQVASENAPSEVTDEVVPVEELRPAEKKKENKNAKIVAVDLQPMVPIPGVFCIQNDITKHSTTADIMEYFNGAKVDLVVFNRTRYDTGLHSVDTYKQEHLFLGALYVTCTTLKHGGNFVAKIFRDKDALLVSQLMLLYKEVIVIKHSSTHDFVVCLNFCLPDDFDSSQLTVYLDKRFRDFCHLLGSNRIIIPFIICGDVSAYDFETPCPLMMKSDGDYKSKHPLEAPILPPYSFLKCDKLAKREMQVKTESLTKKDEDICVESNENVKSTEEPGESSGEQPLTERDNTGSCEKEYESLIKGYLGIERETELGDGTKRGTFQPPQPNFQNLVAEVTKIRAQNNGVCKKSVYLSDYLNDNIDEQKKEATNLVKPCIAGSKLKSLNVLDDPIFFEEIAGALNEENPDAPPVTAKDLNAFVQKICGI